MGGFIYAIPGGGMITEARLKTAGLANIFEGVKYSQRGTTQGPGGGDCMLICIGEDVKQLYFKPEEQTWTESLNGKYRVGFTNDNRPTEKELQREVQLEGHKVKLADSSEWLVPVARIIGGGSMLPASLVLGKKGEVVREELPQYAQFSAKAEGLWEDFRVENKWKKGEIKLTVAKRMTLAAEALAWNYHIGTEEINLLKLITTQNLGEIMAAIIDVPTLVKVSEEMENQKKNAGDAETSGG